MEELAKSITNQIVEMVGEFHGIDTHLAFRVYSSRPVIKISAPVHDGERSRSLSEASLGTANVLILSLAAPANLETRKKKMRELKQLLV